MRDHTLCITGISLGCITADIFGVLYWHWQQLLQISSDLQLYFRHGQALAQNIQQATQCCTASVSRHQTLSLMFAGVVGKDQLAREFCTASLSKHKAITLGCVSTDIVRAAGRSVVHCKSLKTSNCDFDVCVGTSSDIHVSRDLCIASFSNIRL